MKNQVVAGKSSDKATRQSSLVADDVRRRTVVLL
jgi:hypothetical protein